MRQRLLIPGSTAVFLALAFTRCEPPEGPAIRSIDPGSGPASGADVTLRGSGFFEGDAVLFGEIEAASAETVSSSEIRVRTPRLAAGVYDVTVKSTDGKTDTLEDGFEALRIEPAFSETPAHYMPDLSDLSITDGAAADFDLDGDTDILVAVSGDASRILTNSGLGKFTDTCPADPEEPDNPLPGWNGDTRAVAVADYDDDGDADIYVCNGSEEADQFFVNDGEGLFEDMGDAALTSAALTCSAALAHDVNGDGKTDVILVVREAEGTEPPQPRLAVLFNLGRPRPTDRTVKLAEEEDLDLPSISGEVSSIAMADVEGDGDDDMILSFAASEGGVFLELLLSNAAVAGPDAPEDIVFSTAGPGMLPSPPDAAGWVIVLDAEKDGDADVIALGAVGQDRLLLNDGTGHFFDATFSAMPVDRAAGKHAAVADLDLDGLPDLVTANYDGQNRLYINRGDGTFADKTPALPIVSDPTVRTLLLDAESDGDIDIVFLSDPGAPPTLYVSVDQGVDHAVP
jgi:hypothetical protein